MHDLDQTEWLQSAHLNNLDVLYRLGLISNWVFLRVDRYNFLF